MAQDGIRKIGDSNGGVCLSPAGSSGYAAQKHVRLCGRQGQLIQVRHPSRTTSLGLYELYVIGRLLT